MPVGLACTVVAIVVVAAEVLVGNGAVTVAKVGGLTGFQRRTGNERIGMRIGLPVVVTVVVAEVVTVVVATSKSFRRVIRTRLNDGLGLRI